MEEPVVQNPQVIKSKSPLKYLFLALIAVSLFFVGYYFGFTSEKKPAKQEQAKISPTPVKDVPFVHRATHIGTPIFETKIPVGWAAYSKGNDNRDVQMGQAGEVDVEGFVTTLYPIVAIKIYNDKTLGKDPNDWPEEKQLEIIGASLSEKFILDSVSVGGNRATRTKFATVGPCQEVVILPMDEVMIVFSSTICEGDKDYRKFKTILDNFKLREGITYVGGLIGLDELRNDIEEKSTKKEELNKMEPNQKTPEYSPID